MIETKKRNWWAIGVLIFFAVAIIWCLTGVLSFLLGFQSATAYATYFFDDDFESYNLGDLNGQGGWTGDILYDVVDSLKHSGGKGILINTAIPSTAIYKTAASLEVGEFSFWFYPITGEMRYEFYAESDNPAWMMIWLKTLDNDLLRYLSGSGFVAVFSDFSLSEWHNLAIDWYKDGNRLKYRLSLDSGSWTEYFDIGYDNANIVGVNKFRLEGGEVNLGIDDIGEVLPTEPRVWGIDPVSETEITSLEDTFEFGWEGLDEWDTLTVVFKNRDTGILMEAQEILVSTSPSGAMTFNFSDFNPDRNGIFHFFAVAGRSVLETIQGMFITGRWTYEWTDDLVDPEYWLDFNIEGITPIFEMSDFEGWYGEISKFATPTDMAVAITGFFEPIFKKLGEFGNRISDYFNVAEAYTQGYEIGKNIPYFAYFLDQLNMFFGGFPVMKWLFVLILLLVGIFIFRLIMKFIPFLGN